MPVIRYPRGPSLSPRLRDLLSAGVLRANPSQIDRPELVAGEGVDILYHLHRMTASQFPRWADTLVAAAGWEISRYQSQYDYFFVAFDVELNIPGKTRIRTSRVKREYIAAQRSDPDLMLYGEPNSVPVELGGQGRSAIDKAQAIIDMTSSNSPGAYVNKGNPYRVITMVISMRNYGTPGATAAVERRVRAQGA